MTNFPADELFRRLDRELWLLTARDGDQTGGLIATTVMSASISPAAPRVVVGISRQHATWHLVQQTQRFCLQLLPPDALSLVERFGLHSSREIDKFAGFSWKPSPMGQPLFAAAVGWLDCVVEAELNTGDRTLTLAAVEAAQPPKVDTEILTLHQFVRRAPPDWLPRLRQQLADDAAKDLPLIEHWRQTRQ